MKNQPKKLLLLTMLACTCGAGMQAQERLYPQEFPLENVKLLDGPFKKAMELNVKVLLEYDVDRLLQPYQKQAGITQTGAPFTNWAGLDGHVGGHYLSALAIHYVAEQDPSLKNQLKQRLDYMLSQLKQCQDAQTGKMKGYLGGLPDSKNIWTTFSTGDFAAYNRAWVAWYNIHKIYSGLRDVWLYTGSDQARTMFLALCDWGISITSALTDAQMESMLGIEHGGMNEMYADAYQMTGEAKYLTAAKRFSHKWLLNPMNSKNASFLDNQHANTQVPKVIGFERISQLDKASKTYANASLFFWDDVVNKRSLALGGNSRNEHFIPASACQDYLTYREGPESCNTYNMLKLTEDLFSDQPLAKYADFYERALYNHILSTQHPEHGGYVYFTSARPSHYRVYSAVNQAMWCCVGSGMENHGKYGQFVYTHRNDSLYANLFIASSLNWEQKGVTITQNTRFPYEESTKFTVNTTTGAVPFKLFIRHPYWVSNAGFVVKVNGQEIVQNSVASSYAMLERTWANGDIVEVALPMKSHYEQLPNVPSYIALMYGPILLGAKTQATDLTGLVAGEGRMDQVASGPLYALNKAPILVGDRSKLLDSLKLVDQDSLTFKLKGYYNKDQFDSLILRPFYTIHDSRYMMYWMQLTEKEYQVIGDELAAEEEAELAFDQRTVDKVNAGEQQPESDHFMDGVNSYTGTYKEELFRDARNGGWFSYRMLTKGRTDLTLLARYWGKETGSRSFDILIDGHKIASENLVNKWNVEEFVQLEYPIPSSLLQGKDTVTVKFVARAGNTAGGVYNVRLMKPLEVTITDSIRLDSVRIGEAVFEKAHSMVMQNSRTGVHQNLNWRDAENGGYFGYTLKSGKLTGLYLRVRYWGNEGLSRNFHIVVEGDTIVKENITGKWNVNAFKEVDYQIPDDLVKDKSVISVLFDAMPANYAGGVFGLWLLRDPQVTGFSTITSSGGQPEIACYGGRIEVKAPEGEQLAKVILVSSTGSPVYAGEMSEGKLTINTEGLQQGTYVVCYSSNVTCVARKIVVEE